MGREPIMKRLIKAVAVVLLSVFILTSLTGCSMVLEYLENNGQVEVIDPEEVPVTHNSEPKDVDVTEPNDTPAPVPDDTPTPSPVPTEPPTPTPSPVPTPTPTPELPKSFLFGGVEVWAGQTAVSVTGKKDDIIRITPEEMDMLIRLCPNLTSLELDYCCMPDYSRIGELTKLKHLMISTTTHEKDYGIPLVDIDWMASLKDLRTLYLAYNKIDDIRAVAKLGNLEELNLGWNDISDSDLDYLTGLPLRKLYLYCNESLRDVSALSDISSLELLHIGGNRKLSFSGIKKLTALPNLKELDISYCPVEDFLWVQNFKRLETLRIEFSDYIDYYTYYDLMGCQTLRKVVISKEDKQTETAIKDMISIYQPDIELVYWEEYKSN